MGSRLATNLIILITLAVTALLVVLVGLPAWHNIEWLQTETAAAKFKAEAFEARREQLTRLAADRATNRTYAAALRTFLPEASQADDLTLLLETYRRRLALELPSLSLREASGPVKMGAKALPAGVKELTLTLDLVGRFTDLVAFVTSLEQGDRLMEIREAVLSGRDDGLVLAHLEGRAFWKPFMEQPAAPLPAIDSLRRDQFLNRSPATLPDVTLITTGRPDPFAPIE